MPLSSRLLRNTHQLLMQGFGEKRSKQVHFVKTKTGLVENPLPQRYLFRQTTNWFLIWEVIYCSYSTTKTSMCQAWFALGLPITKLRPSTFLDGNGQIGGLVITSYLVSERILDKPLLYHSKFFERTPSLYYDQLSAGRSKNALEQWICYFLERIEETAKVGVASLYSVLDLKKNLEAQIEEGFWKTWSSGQKTLARSFSRTDG